MDLSTFEWLGPGQVAAGTSTEQPSGTVPAPGVHALLDRSAYRAYRRRQAAALLELIPRDAVREVYGHAREWGRERGVHDEKDPMETLRRYCEAILPLPPFHVWREDAGRSPEPHLRESDRRPAAVDPESDAVAVEVRSFRLEGIPWYASLSLFRAHGAWRGFLTFHRDDEGSLLRTAAIFREDDPDQVRTRFRELDEPSLIAFLRSVRR